MSGLVLAALVLSVCSLAGVIVLLVLHDKDAHRDWLEESEFYRSWLEYFIQREEYKNTGLHVQPPLFRRSPTNRSTTKRG